MSNVIQIPSRVQTAEIEYELILSGVEDRIKYYSMELDKASKLYNLLLQNKGDDVL
tara:strand:+ start:752 stop:919 length:168 start_codon:yes stop_codon:yes gene_type:complete